MELFWKGVCAVLLASTLCIITGRLDGTIRQIIALAGCISVCLICFTYLKDIIFFLENIHARISLNSEMLETVLKAVGIGLVSEISSGICSDNGGTGLGKTIQLLGNIAIIWISMPMYESMLNLIQRILGEL